VNPVRIIAEISANHGGDLQTALNLIDLAREADADYVKFQYFTPERMAVSGTAAGLWRGMSLPELYGKAATPADWLPILFDYARAIGIRAFSSVFDEEGLELVARYGPPFIKIASFENTDYPLIAAAAQTRIPVIISTGGMRDWTELVELNQFCREQGMADRTFLKCTSAYPAPLAELGLGSIPKIPFLGAAAGFSDHTDSPAAASLAVALGATMIERHIALSKDAIDGEFSSVGADFKAYVACLRLAQSACSAQFGATKSELTDLRRAVYATCDIAPHEYFSADNVARLRGNGGTMHPKRWWALTGGARARRALKRGEPLQDDDVEWGGG
jgi:pseudaminic acid synthase